MKIISLLLLALILTTGTTLESTSPSNKGGKHNSGQNHSINAPRLPIKVTTKLSQKQNATFLKYDNVSKTQFIQNQTEALIFQKETELHSKQIQLQQNQNSTQGIKKQLKQKNINTSTNKNYQLEVEQQDYKDQQLQVGIKIDSREVANNTKGQQGQLNINQINSTNKVLQDNQRRERQQNFKRKQREILKNVQKQKQQNKTYQKKVISKEIIQNEDKNKLKLNNQSINQNQTQNRVESDIEESIQNLNNTEEINLTGIQEEINSTLDLEIINNQQNFTNLAFQDEDGLTQDQRQQTDQEQESQSLGINNYFSQQKTLNESSEIGDKKQPENRIALSSSKTKESENNQNQEQIIQNESDQNQIMKQAQQIDNKAEKQQNRTLILKTYNSKEIKVLGQIDPQVSDEQSNITQEEDINNNQQLEQKEIFNKSNLSKNQTIPTPQENLSQEVDQTVSDQSLLVSNNSTSNITIQDMSQDDLIPNYQNETDNSSNSSFVIIESQPEPSLFNYSADVSPPLISNNSSQKQPTINSQLNNSSQQLSEYRNLTLSTSEDKSFIIDQNNQEKPEGKILQGNKESIPLIESNEDKSNLPKPTPTHESVTKPSQTIQNKQNKEEAKPIQIYTTVQDNNNRQEQKNSQEESDKTSQNVRDIRREHKKKVQNKSLSIKENDNKQEDGSKQTKTQAKRSTKITPIDNLSEDDQKQQKQQQSEINLNEEQKKANQIVTQGEQKQKIHIQQNKDVWEDNLKEQQDFVIKKRARTIKDDFFFLFIALLFIVGLIAFWCWKGKTKNIPVDDRSSIGDEEDPLPGGVEVAERFDDDD